MYFLGQAGNYRARDIWRHTFSVGTRKHQHLLRQHLAQRYQSDLAHTALYGTGRSALAAALKATIPKNSKVVITALTCYAVVQAVKAAGCVPIFADIDAQHLHYGKKELRRVLTRHPDVKAIIIQNNLGYPVDIVAIERIAKERGLVIIEDLAHSAGIKYPDGREAGNVGSATVLSFGKGKKIDTVTGGALIIRDSTLPATKQPTRRPNLAWRLRIRFYPLLAATVRGLSHFNLHGKNLGRGYLALLLKLHWVEKSADAPLNLSIRPTYWQCRLALRQAQQLQNKPLRQFFLVEDRVKVLAELAKQGYIMNDTWYDTPVAPERYYQKVRFPEDECPNAVAITQQIVNLPTHYSEAELAPAKKIIAKYELKRQIAKEHV